ncbi:MAG: TolC family outer membrane protein [Methylobacteriaceae bacterium]|nr:TolC family outer membrane protein [Methylobacteriaceae bacterium]
MIAFADVARRLPLAAAGCLLVGVSFVSGGARAETLPGALAKAYVGNPDLNQQRASVRATDENVPRQMSGWRPRVTATADAGALRTETDHFPNASQNGGVSSYPRGFGVSVQQNLWNGNRTVNGVRQAESGVLAARETLRNTEQTVLQNAVTSYMNVLRDTAILNLRRNNIEVLEQQVRQTRDRFNVGEVTRTDVAQVESQLAGARADAFTAQSNLQTSLANYRQVVGEQPKSLAPAQPIEKALPKSVAAAVSTSQTEHPLIQAAMHNVDAAQLNVKVVEGELYPTLGVTGTVSKRWDPSNAVGAQSTTASVVGTLTVPIYEGGEVYARVRQAKELLGQARIQADLQREQVRALVVSNWGLWENSRAVLQAAQAQVQAAEIALNGVREEAKVGQRTTLDVLVAQQTLLNARVALVTAQRDRVVTSYSLLGAMGRLSAATLGLRVASYDPRTHFDQVKGKWIGVRTPDGR